MELKISRVAALCPAILFAASIISSCDDDKVYTLNMPEKVAISEIKLNVSPELPIALGADSTINFAAYPENASNPRLKWQSSNELVATVSQEGKISGVGLGKSVITVTPEVGFGAENAVKTIIVQVIPEVIKVTKIEFTNSQTELYEGDKMQLQTVLWPVNHTYSHLLWSSSDPNAATVDENGNVFGVKEGNVTITAKTHDGGNAVASYNLKIKRSIPAQEVNVLPVAQKLYLYQSLPLNFTMVPADATAATLEWSSDDESIISVDQNGVAFAKGFGTTTVTATCSATGQSSSTEVTVELGFYVWDKTNGFPNLSTQNNLGKVEVAGDVLRCTVTTDAAARVCPQLCAYSTSRNTGFFHFSNFPIVGVMADDVSMACTWQINIVNFEKTISVAANMEKRDLGNGKAIYYYDCSALADFAGEDGTTGVRAFVFKIGKSPVETFNIHSIRMFHSADEMNEIFK